MAAIHLDNTGRTMKLFHLAAVFPAGTNAQGLSQVRYYDWYVFDETVEDAFRQIRDHHIAKEPGGSVCNASEAHLVRDAAEVWGLEVYQRGCLLDPARQYHKLETLSQHRNWASLIASYRKVHEGDTSLEKHFDDQRQQRLSARAICEREGLDDFRYERNAVAGEAVRERLGMVG